MLTNVTYMDSSGGDDKQGGTQAQPVKTVARAMELCSIDGWRAQNKLFDVTPGGGNFQLAGSPELWVGLPLGPFATPFAIVGQLSDLFGTLANAVVSTTQLQVPTPGAVKVSTTASIVAGAPAGQMRVSGVPGYTAADNNKLVKVSGAIKGINNETFIIINGAAAAGAIDVLNAGAITGDSSNGSITVHDSYDLDTLAITSGAQKGQTRIVRDTTVAGGNLTLEVLEPFAAAIAIGDTFTVGEPITKFDMLTDTLIIFQNGAASLGLKNIAFSGNVLFFGRMSVNAVSCWFTNRPGSATPGKMTLRNGAQLIGGADGGDFWAADGLDNPFSFTRELRTGVGYKNVEVLAANQASLFFNAHLFRSCKVTVNRAKVVFQPGDGRRTIFIFNPGSIVDFLGTAAQPSKFQGQLASDPATGILNYNGAVSQQLANVVINNSGGHGLRVAQKGFVPLTGTLGGTRNAGIGVIAVDQSEVIIPPGAVGITITGIAGDSKVGTRNARPWASYVTTNPVNNEFDMSGDGSRIAAAGAASNALPQEPPGTVIASAANITLTNTVHHVSGVAALSVMNPPGGAQFRGVIYLIADGDFTWDTVGNFGTAGKAESGRVFPFVFDGARWWPVNVKK
jgi:hypothetical protein